MMNLSSVGNVFLLICIKIFNFGVPDTDAISKLYSCCLGFQPPIVHSVSEIRFYKRAAISQETKYPEEHVSQ